jgi:hypothetical protein
MLNGFKRVTSIVLVVLSVPALVRTQDAPVETIRKDTNLVVLRITASDQQGRAALNLPQGSFKVYEDGVEQRISFSARKNRRLVGPWFWIAAAACSTADRFHV